jgi:hypothetical protein
MVECTWGGCPNVLIWKTYKDPGNETPWAFLCEKHTNQMEQAMIQGDAKVLVDCWANARGKIWNQ